MPGSPKLISRKSLPRIFFHFSHQRKTKNHGCTFCNDVTTITTTIKHYEHNHNIQFDPIILALPHPIIVLLWPCVLVSFDFLICLYLFVCFHQSWCHKIEPIIVVFYWDKQLKFIVQFHPLDVLNSRHGQYHWLHTASQLVSALAFSNDSFFVGASQ